MLQKKMSILFPVDETLDTLGGAHWFTTLDIASGYWQVELEHEDREKTAFSTPSFGFYQFKVMPFGLFNAPSTFQKLMELVLRGLHWSTCLVYLDDIIVFNQTVEEHLQRLEEVLARLQQAGLKIKPSKCHILCKSVKYLGYIVSEKGVEVDPGKTSCVCTWATPLNHESLRHFLGFASYYRKFIPNFAQIAAPLHTLTEKSREWLWTKQCEDAFIAFKTHLTSPPILSYPDFQAEFTVDTDASQDGVGAVLSQQNDRCVIAYASRVLTKPERQYCTTRREMLALVWAVQHFKPYLWGRPFVVRTDHSALQWLRNFKDPQGQVARWLEILSEYDFKVQHRPGVKHGNADPLPRLPCKQCGLSELPGMGDVGLVNLVTWFPALSSSEQRQLQQSDKELKQVLAWMEKDQCPALFPKNSGYWVQTLWSQRDHLVVKDGVLFREWEDVPGKGRNKCLQFVIPQDMVRSILQQFHDAPSGSHLSVAKTLNKISSRFYWPGQRRDVVNWCKSCELCAAHKSPPRKRKAKLQTELSSHPFQRVAMDILGPLPQSVRGSKYILVIGDYFTKWIEAVAIPNMEAVTVAEAFVFQFVSRVGVPDFLHTDQGRNFESALLKAVCTLLGVSKTRTSPYHPQSGGLIERFNRTLLSLLSMATKQDEHNWDLHLPLVMLAYRTSVQESAGCTPFELVFGRDARLPADVMYGLPPQTSPT